MINSTLETTTEPITTGIGGLPPTLGDDPSIESTIAPTTAPTLEPTTAPTLEPTSAPTIAPTIAPTMFFAPQGFGEHVLGLSQVEIAVILIALAIAIVTASVVVSLSR